MVQFQGVRIKYAAGVAVACLYQLLNKNTLIYYIKNLGKS